MLSLDRGLGRWLGRLQTKSWQIQKQLYWHLKPECNERRVVLIIGRQRSGTTLLGNVFERDSRSKVLHEDSVITGRNNERLRMKPLDEVNEIPGGYRPPLIVTKPLVESQRAAELLSNIANSKAIWVFRHFRDVAQSDCRRFRGQLTHLKAIVEREAGNWRTEGVSEDLRATVAEIYDDKMTRFNAAALLWFVRNTLFFDQKLDEHGGVILVKYESLVQSPDATMRRVYRFLELDYPKVDICRAIDKKSLDLGVDAQLDENIESLCQPLWNRLAAVEARHASATEM